MSSRRAIGAGVLTDSADWVQAERIDWPVILATNSTASVFLMPAIVLVSLMNSGTVMLSVRQVFLLWRQGSAAGGRVCRGDF